MLYAAQVRVSLGRNHRRIDVIVEAEDLEKAKEKAIKQARKLYLPDKKAVYSILEIISEEEAFKNFLTPPVENEADNRP
jgi:hypothetical protein